MKQFEIRDPVYGFIPFSDWEKEIIDHPIFQRLRRIKQLALTDLIYPGATHTRFEHSLGAMHFCTEMFDSIIKRKENRAILEERLSFNSLGFERDRQLIRLAALLHDIGHPPFSHSAEEIMPINPKTKKHYRHEDYSCAIIKGPLKGIIEENDHNKSNLHLKADDVAALIEGDLTKLGKKIFWRELISSQLDCDRADYLLRDSLHTGVKYGIYDLSRLLYTLAIGLDPDSDSVILGLDQGGWHVAESAVIARCHLFAQVYFHKTRRAYDYHLKEAMKTVLDEGKLPPPSEIEKYLELDDYSIWSLFSKKKEDVNCKAILYRDHIRLLHATKDMPDKEDEEMIEKLEEQLSKKGIRYQEDRADKIWYNWYSRDKGTNEEIMIIKDDNRMAVPLSEFSSIIKSLGEIKKIRIYVNKEDRDRAREVKNDL